MSQQQRQRRYPPSSSSSSLYIMIVVMISLLVLVLCALSSSISPTNIDITTTTTTTNTVMFAVNAYQQQSTIQTKKIVRPNSDNYLYRRSNNFIHNKCRLMRYTRSSSLQQLQMHMGHSHSHHDHHILHYPNGDTTTTATTPNQNQKQQQHQHSLFQLSNIIRTRRFIAMIIFCTFVAILGPSLVTITRQSSQQFLFASTSLVGSASSGSSTIAGTTIRTSTKLSTRLLTFFGTSMMILIAEPIRNSIQTTIQRIRNIGVGISKHSTPITASYLFQNQNAADRITLLGGVINVILSISKFAVGIMCHSSVLIADAGHSLSDLFSDFVTLWAVQVARLPPDQDHPYGHGKFEAVGSLFLSLTLIGTGIGVGAMANNNLLDILAQQRRGAILSHQIPSLPALAMALFSVVSKEWLFRVTRDVGQRLQSQVVIANAWHHRSDAYSSILAFASIGIAMYIPGFLFVDAAAGIFVAAMIGMTGMEILGESVKQLTDTSNEELVEQVTKLANENVDVEHVVRVRARQVGSASSVDVSVTMPEDRTSSAARAVEERLKQQILQYTAGEGVVVDVDVRATAPPSNSRLNGNDEGMICSALESRVTTTLGLNPISVEEVESCVRDEILRRHSDTVASIEGVTVYYRDSNTCVDVDVNICLVEQSSSSLSSIHTATKVGNEVRATLETSKQISKARIYLDLNQPTE